MALEEVVVAQSEKGEDEQKVARRAEPMPEIALDDGGNGQTERRGGEEAEQAFEDDVVLEVELLLDRLALGEEDEVVHDQGSHGGLLGPPSALRRELGMAESLWEWEARHKGAARLGQARRLACPGSIP